MLAPFICCMVKWWTCQTFCMYYRTLQASGSCSTETNLEWLPWYLQAVLGIDSEWNCQLCSARLRFKPCSDASLCCWTHPLLYALLGVRVKWIWTWRRLLTASKALARCAGWGSLLGRKKPLSSFCKPLWSLCLKRVDRYFKSICRIGSLSLQLCSALHCVCIERYQIIDYIYYYQQPLKWMMR